MILLATERSSQTVIDELSISGVTDITDYGRICGNFTRE
jgi:hypothetical protein